MLYDIGIQERNPQNVGQRSFFEFGIHRYFLFCKVIDISETMSLPVCSVKSFVELRLELVHFYGIIKSWKGAVDEKHSYHLKTRSSANWL